MQKEVHVLGPLLPPGYGTKTQNGEEGTSVDIETFLGEMLAQHGKQSVFFVRSSPFFFGIRISYINFLRFPLVLSTGHQFRNTLTNWSKLWLKRKHHLYVDNCFSHSSSLLTESDCCLWVLKCHIIIGTTGRESQIIRFGNDNQMVPTAIYFKSPGITSQLLLVQGQYLEFLRQLDGSLRMEVLIVLLNLLRAVFPCKDFFSNLQLFLNLISFVEFSSRL